MRIVHTDGGPIFVYLVEGELVFISSPATPDMMKIECINGELITGR